MTLALLIAPAACSCQSQSNARQLDIEISQDTECDVIWVDVKGLTSENNVPLGEGYRVEGTPLGNWDSYFELQLAGLFPSIGLDVTISVSDGWEIQNGQYFFAIDALNWSAEDLSSDVTFLKANVEANEPGGRKAFGIRESRVKKLSGEPNRGEGCRPNAKEPEPLVENKVSEKSEPADGNPLKAEFHLSEGDVCGFFFIDVFGLDEEVKTNGPSLTTTIDGQTAAGDWIEPDEPKDYDGFFEINQWPEGLTDGIYSVTAELDDGTNVFTLENNLQLNVCE